jgi:hypothetical protein
MNHSALGAPWQVQERPLSYIDKKRNCRLVVAIAVAERDDSLCQTGNSVQSFCVTTPEYATKLGQGSR